VQWGEACDGDRIDVAGAGRHFAKVAGETSKRTGSELDATAGIAGRTHTRVRALGETSIACDQGRGFVWPSGMPVRKVAELGLRARGRMCVCVCVCVCVCAYVGWGA
jgi:hypothetical protein